MPHYTHEMYELTATIIGLALRDSHQHCDNDDWAYGIIDVQKRFELEFELDNINFSKERFRKRIEELCGDE